MNIALDTDRVSLIQGDSLSVLKSFADKSFDLVVTDPPYNEHVHDKLGKERRSDGTAARAELTFPPMDEAMIWQVVVELVRVCKGWIIVFSDFYNSALWGRAVRDHGGAWVRTGQWVKTSPMPQMTGDRPATGSEDIVICHAEPKGWKWNGGGHAATWRGRRDQAWPNREEGHPNQKPLWLLQSLLGMFAPPNAVALDPYAGSSGLAVAALTTERLRGESPTDTACQKCAQRIADQYSPPLPRNVSIVGIEGDPKWIELSIARIRATAPASCAA